MRRVLTVAAGYLREASHRKAFYGVVAAAFVLTLMLPLLPSGGLGVQLDLFREASLGLASIMAFLLATVLASTALYGEISRRTIYNALTKGVKRQEYYLGKFIGIAATLLISLSIFFLLVVVIVLGRFRTFNPGMTKAFFTIWLEACLLASVCLLASLYAQPFVSVLLGALFYVVGHVKGHFLYLTMTASDSNPVGKLLAGFFYFILPNLEKLNINETVAHGERVFRVGAYELLLLAGMAVVFTGLFVLLGATAFQRKDL